MAGSNYVAYNLAQTRTDSEKLQARNNIGAAALASLAPAFSTSTAYNEGDVVTYNGKVYIFDTAHPAGAWTGADAHETNIMDVLDMAAGATDTNNLVKNALIVEDIISTAVQGKTIATDVGVGNTVSYTPSSSPGWECVVHDCAVGDVFYITGNGGSTPRLWCFVDTNDKVISVSGAGASTGDSVLKLVAPANGKLIYNANTNASVTPSFKVCVSTENFVNTKVSVVSDEVEFVKKNTLIVESLSVLPNNRIATNVGVGNVVTLTPSSSPGWECVVHDCAVGDVFYITGNGGSTPRLWCFVDTNDKVISVSGAGASTGDSVLKLVAPANGKLICNANTNASVTPSFKMVVKTDDFVTEQVSVLNYVYEKTIVYEDVDSVDKNCTITTNVGVGSTVDYTLNSSVGWVASVSPCSKNDKFFVKGTGGNSARFWCFVDSNDNVVSVASIGAASSSGLVLTAPVDGKLILNSLISNGGIDYSFRKQVKNQDYIDGRVKSVDDKVTSIQKFDIRVDPTPCYAASYLEGMSFSTPATRMSQIYDGFDALVEDFSSLIEKFDAAVLVGLSYPRYANGISAGDADYEETEAYKTFVYKISNENASAGNTTSFPKKKLFIVAGLHGSEYYSPVNCLVIASHILKNPSSDLFDILSLFDIWILPCLNGYGMIHEQRQNANGIDINRSFGTSNWSQSGSPGDIDFSGTTPDSEFETLLVEAMFTYIQPDFYVDHHSYGHSPTQYYSNTASKEILKRSYSALVELSKFLVTNYPTYYGTAYKLFKDNEFAAGTLPCGTTSASGQSEVWANEQGVVALTVEVSHFVNYLDGEYNASGQSLDILWAINEFSLRVQLAKYLTAVL